MGSADSKGHAAFLHFSKPKRNDIKQGAKNFDLNKLMQNVGSEQFDFGTFKNAYDTDDRVKTMVKNFDKVGVEVKTQIELDGGDDSTTPSDGASGTSVSSMAKSATDLGDNL